MPVHTPVAERAGGAGGVLVGVLVGGLAGVLVGVFVLTGVLVGVLVGRNKHEPTVLNVTEERIEVL